MMIYDDPRHIRLASLTAQAPATPGGRLCGNYCCDRCECASSLVDRDSDHKSTGLDQPHVCVTSGMPTVSTGQGVASACLFGCELNLAGLVDLNNNLPLGLAGWQRLVIVGEGAVDTDQLLTLDRGEGEGRDRQQQR